MVNELENLRRQQMTKIQNHEAMRQAIDFASLHVAEGIYPTDIDGIIDYKGKCWIILEYKYNGAPLPDGQRWCLEHLVKRLEMTGIPALAILADHDEGNPVNDIEAGYAIVRAVYMDKKWHIPKKETLVKDMVADYIKWATDKMTVERT